MSHLLSSPSLTVCFPPPFSLSLPKASESPSRASAGPVVLAVTVAVPVCVLSVVVVLAACACQGRRCTYGRKKQPNVEEPLSECNLVSSGKTLKDLIYDMTTSGSGSGTGVSLGAPRLVSTSTVGSGAALLALSLAPCGASEQMLVMLSQVLTCTAEQWQTCSERGCLGSGAGAPTGSHTWHTLCWGEARRAGQALVVLLL